MSIKVAYCIPALYSISGMEKTLTIKANYFADVLNYKVYIIVTDGKGRANAFALSDKIEVINLDINYDKIWSYPIHKKSVIYLQKQWLFRKRLTKVLNDIKPDITVSMLRREINFITKIKDGSLKVGEMHFNKSNYRDFDKTGSPNIFKTILAKLWMNQLVRNLKRLDKFVVLSYEDMEKWVELNNVTVIYNPIATLPNVISDCSSKKVVAAGRFVRQKGFDMLIDAWKIVSQKHPDWTLTIYGSGNKDAFQKQVDDNKTTETCILKDAVLNLEEKFAESSIFAFSSRFEGFGMVISEAMASGLPAVAFACPCGPKDIIEDGVNGLLVELGDTERLAENISLLIENEAMRKEMGKKARIRAERFGIETIAREWNELFLSLLVK
ncbi:MAG: glycosyltransferase family 4 protein [Bacteroidales bacterium]|jgi:glycosyltransferase involved in cell wall biosynthesis